MKNVALLSALSCLFAITATAQQAPGAAPRPSPEEVFKRLDKNHDGRLSFDEFRGNRDTDEAAGWFKARDLDGDGFLSREEFIATTVPNPPKTRM